MMFPVSIIGMENLHCLCSEAADTPLDGCFVEVGVYQGGSAWHLASIAQLQRREIYLYDTFCGIPFQGEDDPVAVGQFGDTSADLVRQMVPYAKVVVGIFPHSLVPMPKVAFAHVDADQYESIRDCCRVLGPMMLPGGKILFDDVWYLAGATRALEETLWPISKTAEGKAIVRF